MNKARMTVQELIDLKPSMDNPIELVCDGVDLPRDFSIIKIIGVYKDRVAFINSSDALGLMHESDLSRYPSFNQPKKRNLEVFYEAIDEWGAVVFCSGATVMTGKAIRKLIPNGRKLIYDHDTKELLAWDEDILK